MNKLTLQIEGMMCSMCETHMNHAIETAFPVKKVTSSHLKNETFILTEYTPTEEELRNAAESAGFTLVSFTSEPYKKFKLFGK